MDKFKHTRAHAYKEPWSTDFQRAHIYTSTGNTSSQTPEQAELAIPTLASNVGRAKKP